MTFEKHYCQKNPATLEVAKLEEHDEVVSLPTPFNRKAISI